MADDDDKKKIERIEAILNADDKLSKDTKEFLKKPQFEGNKPNEKLAFAALCLGSEKRDAAKFDMDCAYFSVQPARRGTHPFFTVDPQKGSKAEDVQKFLTEAGFSPKKWTPKTEFFNQKGQKAGFEVDPVFYIDAHDLVDVRTDKFKEGVLDRLVKFAEGADAKKKENKQEKPMQPDVPAGMDGLVNPAQYQSVLDQAFGSVTQQAKSPVKPQRSR